MAERLSDDWSWPAGKVRYPWDEWLDGAKWRLKRQDDFPRTKTESFVVSARGRARGRGGRLRVAVLSKDEIVIQFEPSAPKRGFSLIDPDTLVRLWGEGRTEREIADQNAARRNRSNGKRTPDAHSEADKQ